MSVDINKCAALALPIFKQNDWKVMGESPTHANLRKLIGSLLRAVEAEDVPPGDFCFHSTNRIHVEKRHYSEEGCIDLEVYLRLESENDR